MLKENEIGKFVSGCVLSIISDTEAAGDALDLDIKGRMLQLFCPGKKAKSKIKNLIESSSKEEIRKAMEADSQYQMIRRLTHQLGQAPLFSYIEELGFPSIDEFGTSGYAPLFKAFYLGNLQNGSYFNYYYRQKSMFADSWKDYAEETVSECRLLRWIEQEVFNSTPQLIPSEPPNTRIFTDENEIEDIIEYYTDHNEWYHDYATAKRAKASSFTGLSGTDHLLAEDYGFQKDHLLLTMISAYGYSYRRNKNNLQQLLQEWAQTEYNKVEADFLLPGIKFRTHDYYNSYYRTEPFVPSYFRRSCLELISKLSCGKWYSADDLWQSYKETTAPMIIGPENASAKNFSLKIQGFTDGTVPEEAKNRLEELLYRPIFKGMLYILAIFGCLKISEKDPELTMFKTKRNAIPYSPFDCLDKVSLTALGNWALGNTEQKPQAEKEFSAPVADTNLLLITYKGKDVAVRNYLARISVPVGDIRFKVTLQSFTSDCKNLKEAEKAINEFRTHINPEPSENWLRFFEAVRNSYNLMAYVSKGLMFAVNDTAAFREIMKHREIKEMVTLCEDGMIFVQESDIQKFRYHMAKLGYTNPFSF